MGKMSMARVHDLRRPGFKCRPIGALVLLLLLLPLPNPAFGDVGRSDAETAARPEREDSTEALWARITELEERVARLEALLASFMENGATADIEPATDIGRVASLISVTRMPYASLTQLSVQSLESAAAALERDAAKEKDRAVRLRKSRAAAEARARANEARMKFERGRRWIVGWLGDRHIAFFVEGSIDLNTLQVGDFFTWEGRTTEITADLVRVEEVSRLREVVRPTGFTDRPDDATSPRPPKS